MDGIQLALLIVGGVIVTVSFFLPARKSKSDHSGNITGLAEEQVKFMVEKEIDDARQHVDELVGETISYAMEKAERSMERISNEKMSAIHEYSDTVLDDINKSQQEVVFLYDMLNNKHDTLKQVVSQAAIAASKMQKTVRDAEEAMHSTTARLAVSDVEDTEHFSPFHAGQMEKVPPDLADIILPEVHSDVGQRLSEIWSAEDNNVAVEYMDHTDQYQSRPETRHQETWMGNRNNNDRILELHKAGISNMAIARELGLGIGEVKLVIDLFEGANEKE